MLDLYIILLVIILFLSAVLIFIIAFRRYDIAVLLVVFSPWISSIFIPNAPLSSDSDHASLGSYIRVSVLLLIGSIGFTKYMKSWIVNRKIPDYKILILFSFLGLAIVSTSYSLDRDITFIRSFSFIAFFLFLLGLYTWIEEFIHIDKVLNIIYVLICIFVIGSLFTIFLFPEKAWLWEVKNRFQGLWNHPNTMGSFCMVSYPILLWKHSDYKKKGKWLTVTILVICAVLHFLTGSRGSLLTSMIGIAIWFIILQKGTKFLVYLIGSFILLSSIIILKPSSFQRDNSTDSLTYLTGRTELWKGALILVQEKPLLGYGYAVEGKVWDDSRFYNPEISLWRGSARASIHNGYLSVAIGVGVTGFIIWCAILFIPFWNYLNLKSSNYKATIVSIMSMGLILNFIESTISGGTTFTATVFWIAWLLGSKLIEIEGKETQVDIQPSTEH